MSIFIAAKVAVVAVMSVILLIARIVSIGLCWCGNSGQGNGCQA